MGIDIDTSKKWMAMNQQAQGIIPSLMDEAAKTGDYTKVSRANQLMDRLSAIGDQHAQQIQNAQMKDQGMGGDGLYPVMAAGQEAPGAPPPQSPLPSLDPQPLAHGTPESMAREAARGATKGAMEAQQGKDAASSALDDVLSAGSALPSFGYGPGELKLQAQPSMYRQENAPSPEEQARVAAYGGLGYGPGELSMKAQDESPASPLPRVDSAADRDRRNMESYNSLAANVALDDVLEAGKGALPSLGDEEDLSKLGAGDLLVRSQKQRQAEALAGLEGIPLTPEPESALPAQEEPQKAEESALPGFQGPDTSKLAGAAAQAEKDFNGDPKGVVNDIMRSPAFLRADDREREFLRRVSFELGERPKVASIWKVFEALARGAGALLGAWITRRYEGQAAMDVDAEGREWDKRRAEIGKEVYYANKLYNRTDMQQKGAMDRAQLSQAGQNSRLDTKEAGLDKRQGVGEAGKDSRLEKTEKGKNERAEKHEAGLDRRHAEYLAFRIKQIESKKSTIRMTPDDQKEYEKFQMIYRSLSMQRASEQLTSAQFTKESAKILDQMDGIINKYRTQQ